MTARQKSLLGKTPKLAAFFFPGDSTTGIGPTTLILGKQDEKICEGDLVDCTWNGKEIKAQILKLSNSRYELNDVLEDYTLENSASNADDANAVESANVVPEPGQNTKRQKICQEMNALTLAVGSRPTYNSSEYTTPAAYIIEEETLHRINTYENNKSEKGIQTGSFMVTNGTQTEKQENHCSCETVLEKIKDIEENRLKRIESMLEQISNAQSHSDVSLAEPIQENRSEQVIQGTITRNEVFRPQCHNPGFWKLYPFEVLGKTPTDLLEMADKVVFFAEKLDLSDEDITCATELALNQRTVFAKSLVYYFFTLGELYNRNVAGRVSYGPAKLKINSEKMKKIEIAVFNAFPALVSEKKKAWSDCCKVINKSLVYLFYMLSKKVDFSPIEDLTC